MKQSEKIAQALQLPKEDILSLPFIKVIGNDEITLGNYGGIIDYRDDFVSFSTSMGIVEIKGREFIIKSITDEEIFLMGKISQFEIREM